MDTAFFCGWAAVPFLVKRGDRLQLDDAELGMLLASSAIVYAAGAFGLPALWVRRDRARIARLAGVGCGLGFVLASWAGAAWQLFLWLSLGRLGLSAFWPNLMALVGEAPGKTLVDRIAAFNCWWGSGKAVSFLLCGSLLQVFGDPGVAMRICGALAILSVLLVPSGGRGVAGPASEQPETPGIERFFVAGLIGVFTAWSISAIWENQFPKGLGAARFEAEFGPSFDLWINVLLFSMFLGQAALFFAFRAWTAWPAKRWTLLLASLLLAGSQVGALASRDPLLTAAILFLGGVGCGICYSHSLYHAQAGRAIKVRRSGIHEGTLSLGFVVGPPVAGHAVVWSGRVEAAFEITIGLALLCLVLTAWLVRRPGAVSVSGH